MIRKYILPFIMLLTVVACEDFDDFTTSPSFQLEIGSDTLKLDTVFSNVPVAAKTFWIHNNSGENIRCSNVRLLNGNQSGYRVNVHGFNLGKQQGYQAYNVEIRNKDSIRVFVELTANENRSRDFVKVEDKIVFQLESGVKQEVNLSAYSWDAIILDSLVVTNDTTINTVDDKPIIINKGIKVCEDATLTIAPGSTLYFHDTAGIDVHGRLICKGTADDLITLRCDRLDKMFWYLPYDNLSGRWQGITFREKSYGNEIDFADIHGGCDAIVCDSSDVEKKKLTLSNTTIHNCMGAGVSAIASNIEAYNCQITNTLGHCVSVVGGNVNLTHCTIAQYYPYDAHRGAALYLSNRKDDYTYPLDRLTVRNSILTGYSADVLSGSRDEDKEIPFEYSFAYCLLRTPVVEESEDVPAGTYDNVIWESPEDDKETTGEKNFVNIDIDLIKYDFHLNETSKAFGAANMEWAKPFNKDGKEHKDGKANIGCY